MSNVGGTAQFPTVSIDRPKAIRDLNAFVCSRAANKSVLNVGAAGNMADYLPDRPHLSTHMKVLNVAKEVAAVDIDRKAIAHANRHGVDIQYGDCETLDLGRTFDLVLWLEVIEHVERPGQALNALMKHVKPGGELIITTPNPTYIMSVVKSALGLSLGIFHDHVTSFFPEHIKVLADRHGFEASEFHFYTQMNNFSRAAGLKSHLLRAIGVMLPRLSNSFLAVIRAHTHA
jgi:2-polyprenyl-3-methyl-5-hydroxy-6-metoxy-1,4-benzoquinol methylase